MSPLKRRILFAYVKSAMFVLFTCRRTSNWYLMRRKKVEIMRNSSPFQRDAIQTADEARICRRVYFGSFYRKIVTELVCIFQKHQSLALSIGGPTKVSNFKDMNPCRCESFIRIVDMFTSYKTKLSDVN